MLSCEGMSGKSGNLSFHSYRCSLTRLITQKSASNLNVNCSITFGRVKGDCRKRSDNAVWRRRISNLHCQTFVMHVRSTFLHKGNPLLHQYITIHLKCYCLCMNALGYKNALSHQQLSESGRVCINIFFLLRMWPCLLFSV